MSVLTFPQGKLVATIANIGSPTGICSDSSGNVWVSAYDDRTRTFYLYKFAHGGTKAIERLRVAKGAWGCAIDPTTGDLAAWGSFAGSAGEVDVFPGAQKGKPIVYTTDFQPVSGVYDSGGNLFADGIVNSGDFVFEELAKDGHAFTPIRLSKPAANPGSVQWDGKHVVVGVGFASEGPVLYRLSGYRGRVVQSVHLLDAATPVRFCIRGGNAVAGLRAFTVRRIGIYDYPSGGKSTRVLSGFHDPMGMTVSI